ncbi:MarR family transcriptional regulator [Rhizobium sp. 2MFCol3.1]|uniref:MarR family winged helix-turn-helix transcriptional regulator n=1 Tax=Rhizobium sp. 2MFCol3.1 TaxID=1246459 RepID=UPI000364034F|nr:MarR family transcriptional regulator [Rhizobium sp. 2MFCol3.1]
MTISYEDIREAPGFLIRRCHQISNAIFLEEIGAADLSPTQFSALATINSSPGIDQTTLGDAIALDRSSVTKCVERLQKRGLIRRTVNKSDRRARKLSSTQEGASLIQQAGPAAIRAGDRLLTALDPEKAAILLSLLKELSDKLNASSRSPLDQA